MIAMIGRYDLVMYQILLYGSGLLVSWMYFAIQESSSYQATVGKRAAGVIVVNTESERISLGQATIRWVIKQIPFVNLISYLIIAIDEKKQGLHDKAAGTYVIFREHKNISVLIIIFAVLGVFILFTVIAAVFSYAMLGAGFFAT